MLTRDTVGDLIDFVEAHTGLDVIDILTMPVDTFNQLMALLDKQVETDDEIDAIVRAAK